MAHQPAVGYWECSPFGKTLVVVSSPSQAANFAMVHGQPYDCRHVCDSRGEPQPLESRRLGRDAALRLRPVFLDAATGNVMATPDWPTGSRDARIIAVHDGKFVTMAGNELALYASDLKVMKKLKLTLLTERYWQVRPSPTGKNFLILPVSGRAGSWLWLETDTLRLLHRGRTQMQAKWP